MHRERGHHSADIGEEDVEMKERKKRMKQKKMNIKRMSYQERQAHYEQEKNELLFKNAALSGDEYQKLQDELVRKWGI